MDYPENAVMEVRVVVAFTELQTAVSEEAWEQDIVDAVSAAVYADKTLDTLAVRRLKYEDGEWILDGGTPMPECDVTAFQDGSWHSSTELFQAKYEAGGQGLQRRSKLSPSTISIIGGSLRRVLLQVAQNMLTARLAAHAALSHTSFFAARPRVPRGRLSTVR